ncbi:gamma-glutamyltransferase [Pseudoroseicyclus sp. CLL3-39]|uniref:Glutathione hydrolase proenzyme n=2 Tax=Pseudoroseicyclus tamaricis TaxID=2705421 RepID=A0A6B2JVL1_9RHOB|nr:gamma-glutamyltransferase [Pseudoroseicyclus tamaricis]
MVVANHPLASAAGMEMLAAGGNAVDAAVAALFMVTVVEPAMVGIVGGGAALIRTAEGEEVVIDGMCAAPMAAREDSFTPLGQSWPASAETVGRKNRIGAQAVAVPGNLAAWVHAVERYGRLSLADVLEPAISRARRGFVISPYLAFDIDQKLPDVLNDPGLREILAPGGEALGVGDRLVQADYAATLEVVAREGAGYLHGGAFGQAIADHMVAAGGFLTLEDLTAYEVIERAPVRTSYRGHEVIGVAPPCSGGVSVAEILNILQGYDLAALGYGSPEASHLIVEAMKIATADRDAHVGDPAFHEVPVARLISKAYAAERRAGIDPARATPLAAAHGSTESKNTTHVTAADGDGTIITTTQTINSTFGACVVVPGTGAMLNNYMYIFNPLPGLATSIAPGKRVTGNIGATIVTKEDRPIYALGLPGSYKIPSVVAQTLVNLIDHGMDVQEAAEAPRLFAKGPVVEVERGFDAALIPALRQMGHPAEPMDSIAGCMGAISFGQDGAMTGASCWRADGVPMGSGGGPARTGVTFWPDPDKRTKPA